MIYLNEDDYKKAIKMLCEQKDQAIAALRACEPFASAFYAYGEKTQLEQGKALNMARDIFHKQWALKGELPQVR